MVTVTLDEVAINAITAALDERTASLSRTLSRIREQPATVDQRFAVDTLEQAIRNSVMAQLTIAQALVEPEYPSDMSVTRIDAFWTESEKAWGQR